MLKDIDNIVRLRMFEAYEYARKCIATSNASMQILVEIPSNFNEPKVIVQGSQRPFPVEKWRNIERVLRGDWDKRPTLNNFTMLTSLRTDGPCKLLMRFYTGPCLNRAQWDKVEVTKGSRGKVLTPPHERVSICNDDDFSLMGNTGPEEKEKTN